MKDSKKYFKDINKLFPVHSYKEKKYLNDLKEQIDEYDDLSYHELEEQFGTPIDIVVAYYETIDTKYILKKNKNKTYYFNNLRFDYATCSSYIVL